jgi:hypothetical protein
LRRNACSSSREKKKKKKRRCSHSMGSIFIFRMISLNPHPHPHPHLSAPQHQLPCPCPCQRRWGTWMGLIGSMGRCTEKRTNTTDTKRMQMQKGEGMQEAEALAPMTACPAQVVRSMRARVMKGVVVSRMVERSSRWIHVIKKQVVRRVPVARMVARMVVRMVASSLWMRWCLQ